MRPVTQEDGIYFELALASAGSKKKKDPTVGSRQAKECVTVRDELHLPLGVPGIAEENMQTQVVSPEREPSFLPLT